MASVAPQLQSSNSGVNNVANLLTLLKGNSSSTTSGSTVSDKGIQELINQILASNSGLASVASGQKGAGVYNSSTNRLLINDLITQTAAKAELARAGTTSKTKSPGLLGENPLLNILGLTAGAKVLGPSIKKFGVPLDELGNKLSTTIFGDGVDATVANTVPATSGIDSLAAIVGGGSSDAVVGSIVGDAAATVAGSNITTDAAIAAGSEAALGAAGGTAGIAALGSEFGTDALFAAATESAAGESIGSLFAAALAWIICSELLRQRRMPLRHYIYGAKEFAKYDKRGKQGYYLWAIPSVRHLRAHPDSWYSWLLEKVFNCRARYLAAKAGCKGVKKTIPGFLVTHGLYWICWTLSRTLARKPIDWTSVYIGV